MSPKSRSRSPSDQQQPQRQTRSDFYLEPNPFEESFKTPSNVRGEDNSQNNSPNHSPKQRSSSPNRPVLPPLASISSPADPTSYPWAYNANSINSLRSGPLSPAMLAGPQQNTDQPTA